MTARQFQFALLVATLALIGCNSPQRPPDNLYANKTEAAVRSELGKPRLEFAGHYGNPPATFKSQFTGEIKTLVFKKSGGDYYVSFEKRTNGWISICSSWVPSGAVF